MSPSRQTFLVIQSAKTVMLRSIIRDLKVMSKFIFTHKVIRNEFYVEK